MNRQTQIDEATALRGTLNLLDAEDRAIFRQRVAGRFQNTKLDYLRELADVGNTRRRPYVVRTIADDWMDLLMGDNWLIDTND